MDDNDCLSKLNLQVGILNENLVKLINIFRFSGKYDSFEEDISPGEMDGRPHRIQFSFPARQLTIRANQAIYLQINNRNNPYIYIEMDEYPFELNLPPAMLVQKIYISTGANVTHVKVIIFG